MWCLLLSAKCTICPRNGQACILPTYKLQIISETNCLRCKTTLGPTKFELELSRSKLTYAESTQLVPLKKKRLTSCMPVLYRQWNLNC
ncbi:hypothetical protein PAHAL_9G153600 [Panicum hallii]|uniref:Uncharacterized protein n=1 Tax=Panicum hallii TaxID=206008 RepID=A0A2T8I1C9_9POAL|nr:hypothetical protein PAHAL_9G153600 [Panicum hallii]